jgi:hypothetical protein
VLGNYIGVTRIGRAALGNGLNGVVITNATGCMVGDNSGEARNVISGNGDDGVEIGGLGTSGNWIMGNYIGTSSNGTAAIPNGGNGVLLTSECTQNTVGDTTVLGRNLISGNNKSGVTLGEHVFGNWVYGNNIGLVFDGLSSLMNSQHGVLIENGSFNNYIGNASVTNSGNLISGNGYTNTYHGVCIQNGAYGNEVARNRIGLNAHNGSTHNAGDGIRIQNSDANTIGGTDADDRNFISGNGGCGIQLGTNATGNTVLGNFIGLDTNGVIAVPNSKEGVLIYRSSQNQIGTSAGGSRNVISGNAGSGVMISDNASARDNTVEDNYIGTDVSGGIKVGNSDHGVYISGGVSNLIGGYVAGGNVISGNNTDGVRIQSDAMYNLVYRNFIGVDASGAAPLGNGNDGASIYSSSRTTIGDPGGRGNVIGGNAGDGVHISGSSAVSNAVRANKIGTDGSLTINLSNRVNGVWIGTSASGNTIGGTNASLGNQIYNNGGAGIRVVSGTNNALLGNWITSNRLLGIDIDSLGVSPNDIQDPDTGANFVQNFPVIYEATTGSVVVAGLMNSRPLTTYRLEFYRCNSPDPSGYGEGNVLMAVTNATTDASGNALFEFTLTPPTGSPKTGEYVTATATDPYGNTSEFAKNVQVVPNELYGDADGDGMPTRWEGPNHLSPTDATGTNGAAGDPDGDGVDNFDEYVADTAPSDSNSYFRIVNIDIPSNALVTYTSTNTRYYVASGTTNPVSGTAWANLYPLSVQGSNGVTAADDSQSLTSVIYRVNVQLVP